MYACFPPQRRVFGRHAAPWLTAFLLAAGACGSEATEPLEGPRLGEVVGAISQGGVATAGCKCDPATSTYVDFGTSASYHLNTGESLCIEEGIFNGTVSMSAGSVVCVDTDAAYEVANTEVKGQIINYGRAGKAAQPLILIFVTGSKLDNHGVVDIGGVNFNGAAEITNYAGAEMNFRAAFALSGGSTLVNEGIFRAADNFDTREGTIFRNEGYGYISAALAFSGESDNHGLLEITNGVNINSNAHFNNYCTLISYRQYNVNGNYDNDGLAYLYGLSGSLDFNITSAGRLVLGSSGSVIGRSLDGPGGNSHVNLRVDGRISGEGTIYFEDQTVCQGSAQITGTPLLHFYDATLANPATLLDQATCTIVDVVRGSLPALPTLEEARSGRIGSDCRSGNECQDTAGPGAVDEGCTVFLPSCVPVDDTWVCVECSSHGDCSPGFACNREVRRCQPAGRLALVDDTLSVAEGSSVSLPLVALAANDSGVDPSTITLGAASHGTLTVANGILTYTPGPSSPAVVIVPYFICTEPGVDGLCDTANIIIHVNRAPTLAATTIYEPVGAPATQVVLPPRFTDPDGDALDVGGMSVVSVTSLGGDLTGTATVVNGTLTFVPTDPNAAGLVLVTVSACDQGSPAACTTSAVVIVRNDPPVLANPTVTVAVGELAVIPLASVVVSTGVVHGDDPSDGDTDGIGAVSVVSGPCVWDSRLARFTAPGQNARGEVMCEVRVCEELPAANAGGPVCATASVRIVVAGRPPIAQNDGVATSGSVLIDVLQNDIDPDGDHLEIRAILVPPLHGTATIEDGRVRYVPVAGFIGVDTFEYRVCDIEDLCDIALVTVVVGPSEPTNRAPVASNDIAAVDEDGEVVIDVLANDVDPDGDVLAVRSVVTPAHGVVTLVAGGIRYVPDPDFHGTDSFSYEVCDPAGLCDTAVVTVIVRPVNDAPVAVDDWASTFEGESVTIPVLDNDYDVDGDPLTLVSVSEVVGGTAVIDGDQVVFTPAPGFVGQGGFVYVVRDPSGAEARGTVVVEVTERDPGAEVEADVADADDSVEPSDTAQPDTDGEDTQEPGDTGPEPGDADTTDTSEPSDTTGDTSEPSDTTGDTSEPSDTTDTSGPSDTTGDTSEPSDTTGDTSEPSDTTGDTSEPSDTTGPSDTTEPGDTNQPDATSDTAGPDDVDESSSGLIAQGGACSGGAVSWVFGVLGVVVLWRRARLAASREADPSRSPRLAR